MRLGGRGAQVAQDRVEHADRGRHRVVRERLHLLVEAAPEEAGEDRLELLWRC